MLMLRLLQIRFRLVPPSSRLYASRGSGQRVTDQVVNLPAGLDTSSQPSARFGLRSEYVRDMHFEQIYERNPKGFFENVLNVPTDQNKINLMGSF